MRLSVLYRTFPGSNDKRRPDWSSRTVALLSLREALDASGVDSTLTFVADGGLPDELASHVGPGERVVIVDGGSAAASFRRCVDVAAALAAHDPAETFYWLAEDDYLYRPDAFVRLSAAVDEVASADYFALYTADGSEWSATHKSQPDLTVPDLPEGRPTLDGVEWRRVRGTTSTFGVRGSALLADQRVLKLGSMVGAPFDGATWHALQGVAPFSWRHLLHDLDAYWSPRGVAKIVAKPVMRTVLNLEVARARSRARLLAAPVTDLAAHLEDGLIPAGYDWEARARALTVA